MHGASGNSFDVHVREGTAKNLAYFVFRPDALGSIRTWGRIVVEMCGVSLLVHFARFIRIYVHDIDQAMHEKQFQNRTTTSCLASSDLF